VVDIGATDDVDKAGYYAGFVGAAFMAGRTVSSFFWGIYADRYGRKPVILIGCASIAVLSVLFGVSTTFSMALVTRFLIGLGNGIAGTSKTIVAELCSEDFQPRAMGFVTGTWSLGLILGPALGGVTARQTLGLPGIFGRFPYLLPNLITAAIACYAFYQTWFYLPETAAHLLKDQRGVKGKGAKGKAARMEAGDEELGMLGHRQSGRGRKLAPMGVVSSDDTDSAAHRPSGIIGTFLGMGKSGYQALDTEETTDDEDQRQPCDGAGSTDASTRNGAEEGGADSLLAAVNDEGKDEGEEEEQEGGGGGGGGEQQLNAKHNSEEGAPVEPVDVASPSKAPGEASGAAETAQQPEAAEGDKAQQLTMKEILYRPMAIASLILYCTFCLVIHASDEILPLWAIASQEKGGFGGTPTFIGIVLSITGGLMGVFQLIIYPLMTPYVGPRDMLIFSNLISIPFYLLVPFTARMQRGLGDTVLVLSVRMRCHSGCPARLRPWMICTTRGC